jgi:hypothetical protein
LSYLRFTPAEYRAIARACRERDLMRLDLSTFHLLLAAALADARPDLADRIGGLSDGETLLLQQHLRTASAAPGVARPALTPAELRTVTRLCAVAPATTRFAGVFRRLLLRHLRKSAPGLARKVARLSDAQFEELFRQAQRRRPGNA